MHCLELYFLDLLLKMPHTGPVWQNSTYRPDTEKLNFHFAWNFFVDYYVESVSQWLWHTFRPKSNHLQKLSQQNTSWKMCKVICMQIAAAIITRSNYKWHIKWHRNCDKIEKRSLRSKVHRSARQFVARTGGVTVGYFGFCAIHGKMDGKVYKAHRMPTSVLMCLYVCLYEK